MNSKEQKIKDEWLKFGISENIDIDGWADMHEVADKNTLADRFHYKEYSEPINNFETTLCRPKSLQGIENNAGWIKIESEDDLAKDYDSLYDVCNNQNVDSIPMTLHQVKYLYDNKKITHYQKHNKKLPPIY